MEELVFIFLVILFTIYVHIEVKIYRDVKTEKSREEIIHDILRTAMHKWVEYYVIPAVNKIEIPDKGELSFDDVTFVWDISKPEEDKKYNGLRLVK